MITNKVVPCLSASDVIEKAWPQQLSQNKKGFTPGFTSLHGRDPNVMQAFNYVVCTHGK